MKIRAAEALAGYVVNPTEDMIIPGPFDPGIADVVAEAMAD
jgi:malate dehydrogenase (oxaloacetate-decarboxylating)